MIHVPFENFFNNVYFLYEKFDTKLNLVKLFPSKNSVINLRLHKLKLYSLWVNVDVKHAMAWHRRNFSSLLSCNFAFTKGTVFDFIVNVAHHNMDRKTMAKVFNLCCLCKVRKCWLYKSGEAQESGKMFPYKLWFFSLLHCYDSRLDSSIKTNLHRELRMGEKVTINVAFLKCHSDPKFSPCERDGRISRRH